MHLGRRWRLHARHLSVSDVDHLTPAIHGRLPDGGLAAWPSPTSKTFAHLTESDVEALGAELDAIRRDIESSRAASAMPRTSVARSGPSGCWRLAGRATMFAEQVAARPGSPAPRCSRSSKIIENMELGHNVSHGQWDWMNDPEIHSTSWEWDMTGPLGAVEARPQLLASHCTPTSSAWMTTSGSASSG